ncbi:Hha/YmoA family nucleoid-associated regulatory protein [Enterobacter ludwigii]|uniref:Hha/YmoA family nucleoid-associated regulatory protein n=1 Tax=Enterobacteriaceae TaxID=543 RepID=UPI0012B6B7D7|nr:MULTISPECIES: Hha/YmoA family nucleoid-associated regulatory protein [Enterobacteriaceae]MDE4745182.1 Hha/YmoA family nucleoid-associated regulatory protein [Klebsiella pneumoniae]
MKTKMDYVRQFRQISDADNLERVIGHMETKLSDNEFQIVLAAADHRKAEMALNRYFDKVPKDAWRYVR